MKRNDLGSEYNGWQIVDSTPQERSFGLFQLGPASREAVKKGLIGYKYDTSFVFAEVSADRIYYVMQKTGKFKHYLTEKGEVGKYICTKKVGCKERKDLTSCYKKCQGASSTGYETYSRSVSRRRSITGRCPIDTITIVINMLPDYKLGSPLKTSIRLYGLTKDVTTDAKVEINLVSYRGKLLATLLNDSYNMNSKSKI